MPLNQSKNMCLVSIFYFLMDIKSKSAIFRFPEFSKIKYFTGVNQKKTKQVIKPPTLVIRSANRCRLVPVYDRFKDMMNQTDSFPFGLGF